MGGKTRIVMRTDLRLDLKDSGAVWLDAELNRCIERAVADLSRYLPREKVYEKVIVKTVTDESWTSPATTSLAAIVSAADINVAAPALLTIAGQPDVPRVLTLTMTDANSSAYGVTFTIRGMDRDEIAQTEIFHYSRGDSKTIVGKKEFKYVYEVEMTSNAGSGVGDTLSVGYGLFTGAWVSLANKPIKEASETVENAAGTTSYTRNTDYIMDYANGKIRPKAGGGLAAATAYLISYTIDEVSVDLSAVPDFIRYQRVEYPVGEIPQSFVPADIFGSTLVVTGAGEAEQQSSLSEHKHLRVYYDAQHFPPNDYTPGSVPEFLEITVEQAASAYALLIYALKQELAAETAITSQSTSLAAATTAHTALATALTNVKKYLDNNSAADAAGNLLLVTFTATDAALTNAIKYLNNNTTVDMAGMLAGMTTDLAAVDTALVNVKKYLDNNTSNDAAAVLASLATEFTAIETALTASITYLANNGAADAVSTVGEMDGLITAADVYLGNIATYLGNNAGADAKGLLAQITTDIANLRTGVETAVDAIKTYLDAVVATDITAAQGLTNTYMGTTNFATKATSPSILDYLDDGDALLNTITLGGENEHTAEVYAEYAARTRDIIASFENLRRQYADEGQLRVNASQAYAVEASQRLSNLRTYIEQSQAYVQIAQGYYQAGSAVLEEANLTLGQTDRYISIAQSYVAEATQRVAEVAQYLSQATGYTQVAQGFYQNAVALIEKLNVYIAKAAQYRALAGGFIDEADRRLGELDRYLAKVQQYVNIANSFARESEARIAEIAQYNVTASGYGEAASACILLADRYRTEATERRNEVYAIWTDRKQLIGDFSMGSVRQLPMSQES